MRYGNADDHRQRSHLQQIGLVFIDDQSAINQEQIAPEMPQKGP